jgi:uncharacterized protein (DUF58 family)
LLIRLTLILAALALLVPVAVWLAPILAATFIALIIAAIAEAILLRRTTVSIERAPKLSLPLDEPDIATIRITTTSHRSLQLTIRQRWPMLVTPRSQTQHAICRPREVLSVDLAARHPPSRRISLSRHSASPSASWRRVLRRRFMSSPTFAR